MNKITPSIISELKENEVFVFGSNLGGIHGAGAAKAAMKWGARLHEGIGHRGQTYAIPTKDRSIMNTLTLSEIKKHVEDFIYYAKTHPNHEFLVTPIGCGLAGLKPVQVAPLFKQALTIENVSLPLEFLQILNS